MKGAIKMKYKVGDYVRIKDNFDEYLDTKTCDSLIGRYLCIDDVDETDDTVHICYKNGRDECKYLWVNMSSIEPLVKREDCRLNLYKFFGVENNQEFKSNGEIFRVHNGILQYKQVNGNWGKPFVDMEALINNGIEVVWKPKVEDNVYIPSFTLDRGYEIYDWFNTEHQKRLLDKGLVFRTAEEARNYTQKCIEMISKGDN